MDFAQYPTSETTPRNLSAKKFLTKKQLIVITVVALILLGAGAAGFYYISVRQRDPIPQSIIRQMSFPLYYPDALPKNWKLDKSSIYDDPSANVVGYRLQGPGGNLSVTIQPVPPGFNFNDFYTKRLSNTVQFLTPLGQGAVGKSDQQLVGSLVTTSSWVLAAASSSSISQTDIQFILSHLQTTST